MRIAVDAGWLLDDAPGGLRTYATEILAPWPQLRPGVELVAAFRYLRGRHAAAVEGWRGRGFEARVARMPPQILDAASTWLPAPERWFRGRADRIFLPAPAPFGSWAPKLVVTVHDLIPLTHPQFCEPTHIARFGHWLRRAVARADALLAISGHTRDVLCERAGARLDQVRVVPNGVRARFFDPVGTESIAAARRQLGIDGPYLLYVGVLEPRKNLVRLVDAFGASRASSDHALVLAGRPAWRGDDLDAALGRLPKGVRVVRQGPVPDALLPALYAGATAFLYPSLAEGFGLPPLEAMASGCPTLVADATSLPEIVGEAALIVDPLRTEAMTDAIDRLVGDGALRALLSRAGPERAKTFSWARSSADTLAAVEDA